MNKDNAHLYLPLVQALADGKVIQVSAGFKSARVWSDLENVEFTESPGRYRIKPEPREWWLVLDPKGRIWATFESEDAARDVSGKHLAANFPIVHVREVTQ